MSDGCSGKPQFDSCFWLRDRITDRLRSATPVMSEDTLLPFDLPSVARKKLSIGFHGGQLSSDAGVLVLRGVEKKLGLAARLAACIRDRRKPERRRLRFAPVRSDLQDGGRPCAGERRSFVLAAHHVAAGECAVENRDRPTDGGAGGRVLRKLPARAVLDHARHRRHTSTWRLLPPRLAGGINGSTCAHSSSVRSLGYRNLLRS